MIINIIKKEKKLKKKIEENKRKHTIENMAASSTEESEGYVCVATVKEFGIEAYFKRMCLGIRNNEVYG